MGDERGMDKWVGGWTDEWVDGWTCGPMDRQMNGGKGKGRLVSRHRRGKDGWMNG